MADDTNTAERDLVRIAECAARLVEHADFRLGGVLSADSKTRDIPSRACSQVKSRHLAALRDALAGRASLAASAGGEPVKRVFLVHTGEEHEGEATYTRHDDAPPPLCDSECLYTHPSPPEGMAGWRSVPVELIKEAIESIDDYRSGLEFGKQDRRLLGMLKAVLQPLPASEAKEL